MASRRRSSGARATTASCTSRRWSWRRRTDRPAHSSMKLVSTIPFSPDQVAQLRRAAPGLAYVEAGTRITDWSVTDEQWRRDLPGLLETVADADAVVGAFGSTAERLTAAAAERTGTPGGGVFRQVMRAASRVRWVHCRAAGVDKLLFPELRDRGVTITCGKGEAAGSLLAEHAFGAVLAYARGILTAARARSWAAGRAGDHFELRGKTMGIVGFGGAGRALADRAIAFGMDVLAIRRH